MKIFSILAIMCALFVTPLQGEESFAPKLREEFLALKYSDLTGDEEHAEIRRLHTLADEHISKNSEDAKELVMRARILAYDASLTGGMEGLKMVTEAKELLEKSIEIDANVYNGYAHVLMGLLYDRVPPWPIGFGNLKKAVKHFELAMEIDPEGYESNYTYGEYLAKRRKHEKAIERFEAAKSGVGEDQYTANREKRIDSAIAKSTK